MKTMLRYMRIALAVFLAVMIIPAARSGDLLFVPFLAVFAWVAWPHAKEEAEAS